MSSSRPNRSHVNTMHYGIIGFHSVAGADMGYAWARVGGLCTYAGWTSVN